MHGHVEPEVFADDLPFADPAQLLIVPDHYVFRMLASQGIEPARLGVPRIDGGPVETDSRKIWRTFCENWKLFRGTPSRYWLEHELVEVFGVDQRAERRDGRRHLRPDRRLRRRARLPAAGPARPLQHRGHLHHRPGHLRPAAARALAADGLGERVLPTFRPDARRATSTGRAGVPTSPSWRGCPASTPTTYDGFLDALRARRAAFVAAGARATDHGHLLADTTPMEATRPASCTPGSSAGEPSAAEVGAFAANMLFQMAEMSCEDGLVMQIHPGVLRDHNTAIGRRTGRTRATTSRSGPSSPGRCARCWTGSAPIRGSG